MGQFQGSLRLPGDSRPLPATVQLSEGRLQVASGEHVIGDWPVDAIDISHVPEGIKVKAEGEVLLLELPDRDAFAQAAASQTQKPKRLSVPKRAAKTPAAVSPKPAAAKAVKVKTAKSKTPKVRGESKLDAFLARAQDRYGAKLPNWVFGRWGIAAAVALVAFCVIFAELVSNLLLIAGVIVLLVGGVTMLDSVIARRLLHHKITPIQVVLGGGGIFVVGLIVGFAA
ncbi:MAG TPA: hypothetical protein VFU96_06475 [Acidimicrobiia bacterium]|nr:hypothetical protein [Acidimicrobiia bacterium]